MIVTAIEVNIVNNRIVKWVKKRIKWMSNIETISDTQFTIQIMHMQNTANSSSPYNPILNAL